MSRFLSELFAWSSLFGTSFRGGNVESGLGLQGAVVDIEERRKKGKTTYFPVVSYQGSETDIRFTSKYGSSQKPRIPSEAEVIISPDGGAAEHYSSANRWMLSLIPLAMALLLILKGTLLR